MIKQFMLLMLVLAVGSSADDRLAHNEIRLLSPENGTTIYVPHPHLRWQKEAGADIEDQYRVQVSRDEAFHTLVVDDLLDVVSRMVCAKPLSPGTYFWRVRREDQTRWSKVSRFTRGDSKQYPIKKGATTQEIAAVIAEAAANAPAKVIFEQGDYPITDMIPLSKVKDLIIDGNGGTLTLKDRFLDLKNCADITVCNMTVQPARQRGQSFKIQNARPFSASAALAHCRALLFTPSVSGSRRISHRIHSPFPVCRKA